MDKRTIVKILNKKITHAKKLSDYHFFLGIIKKNAV